MRSNAGMQPKLLLPLAAAAFVLAAPAAANAAITPPINGNVLTLTGDATDDNITIGVNDAGLLTHNFGGDDTDFDSGPPGAQTLPSNDTIAVTLNLGAGNDTTNLSRREPRRRHHQRRSGRRHHRRPATTSTPSAAATATTASPASAATTSSTATPATT